MTPLGRKVPHSYNGLYTRTYDYAPVTSRQGASEGFSESGATIPNCWDTLRVFMTKGDTETFPRPRYNSGTTQCHGYTIKNWVISSQAVKGLLDLHGRFND